MNIKKIYFIKIVQNIIRLVYTRLNITYIYLENDYELLSLVYP